MFSFIKNRIKSLFSTVTSKLGSLFGYKKIDEQTLAELELILINADVGVQTTKFILDNLRASFSQGTLETGTQLKEALAQQLLAILQTTKPFKSSDIYLMVGINGSGKTTFAGKLAHKLKQEGKRVLFVAADTFRAAAPQQLHEWAQRIGCDIVIGSPGQDPASVIFKGCEQFKTNNYDALIIDTAGRLQTKTNLMLELEKIKKVIAKHIPDSPISTLITIDSMLGQNSFEQAKLFHESTQLDGIVLTKMDGTGKGGIVFAIAHTLTIPVAYVSFGEQLDNIEQFNAQEFVTELLGK